MIKLQDTCALLDDFKKIFEENDKILISSITIEELENIKNSFTKDSSIKCKARHLVNFLVENTNKQEIIPYGYKFNWDDTLSKYNLPLTNDSRIIYSAIEVFSLRNEDLQFITKDLNCKIFAQNAFKLYKNSSNNTLSSILIPEKKKDNYTGFKEVNLSEELLANFYLKVTEKDYNPFDLLINEYIIIKDSNNKVIDIYKMTPTGMEKIIHQSFSSYFFGETKAKDTYQKIAIDTLKNNQISMIRGAAGTGKSYLALSCLFDKMRRGEIDKIIIFCNTVATADSAKLGYYPGDKNSKLLDSQIGNFLRSKIPDQDYVNKYVTEEKIILLPMSDIRGYDTTGLRAGVYITEAQNMSIELMKLALQRIGEDSICIIDGDDDTQVDLPQYAGSSNGMRRVSEVFRGNESYGEVTLQVIHRSKIAELAQKM